MQTPFKIATRLALKYSSLLVFFLIFESNYVFAKESKVSIGTDAIVVGFGGFGLNFKRSSTFVDNLTIGVGGVFIDVPSYMFSEYDNSNDRNWKVNANVVKLFFDYHFKNPNEGLSMGLFGVYEKYDLKRNDQSTEIYQQGIGARVSYTWRPFGDFFYIMPSIGYLHTKRISGDGEIDGATFNAEINAPQGFLEAGLSF